MSEYDDLPLDNLGRCDVCGKIVDVEHTDDEFVISEPEAVAQFSVDEVIDGLVRALRAADTPQDHMVADAYEEHGCAITHGRCWDTTTLGEAEAEADG